MPDFVLNDFLPYQLAVLSSRISREFSALYKEKFGISVAEWRVVAHLSQTQRPVSVREIYARVDLDKSKVSRAATRLETRGYVVKKISAADRRLVALYLSQSGRDMVSVLTPLALEFERNYLNKLSTDGPAFQAAVRQLLQPDA
jgi:DNA-binding MarR family transcriptional regulator